MHWATFPRPQRRTGTRSGRRAWAGTLENRLTRYWTSRNRTRSGARMRGWRSLSRRGFVHGTRSGVRHDHAWRRCLRSRRRNRRRWFRCYRSCWLCRRRRNYGSGSRSLGSRRHDRRMCRRRNWRSCSSSRWWLCRWRNRNGKCRPRRGCWNNHPRRRNGRCRWRRRRFHGRSRWRCGRSTNRRTGCGSGCGYRSLLLANRIQNIAWPGNIG